mmetsp:Transcript_22651/g.65931  ORF Transcript_22651/g.65931 Transcript_22651/m.65931 type:complete len:300 (+) Transcript_22651:1079-1978(+)
MLGLARELFAQQRVLGGHAHGARVQVALAHHDAPQGDEWRCREAELLGPEECSDHHVAPVLQLAVGLELHPGPEVVQHQGLLRFGDPELPGQPRALHPGPGRGPGAAVVAADGHVVGLGLGHARGHHADPNLRHQLHRYLSLGLGVLQVVDQLRQVLNRVNVVVRRGADQPDTRGGASAFANIVGDFEPWELTPLPRLGPLGHFDLDLVRVGQVVGGHTEPPAGHLLDRRSPVVQEPHRVLASLTRVALGTEPVHGHCQGLVGFLRNGAQAHGPGHESLDDLLHGLHLVEGHGLGGVNV